MLIFWLLITVLIVIALGFIIAPLLTTEKPNRLAIITLLLLLATFSSLALFLYQQWGNSHRLADYYRQQKNAQAAREAFTKIGSPTQVIAKLKAQMQYQPEAKGWYLLGRLYLSQGNPAEAVEAFTKAYQLKPHDTKIMLQLGEAIFLQQHQLTAEAKTLINEVLRQQPDNAEALNILAIDAYQQGQYQEAIDRWERLLNQYSADSEEGQKLLEAIAKAQAALKQTKVQPKIQLPVQVMLAAAVKAKVSAEDTVFIYAQAAEGPKMPLAIIRKQVKDLPIKVTLDETMAMMPAMTLDKFNRVRIIARISQSGQAIPQAGDWIGSTNIITIKPVPAQLKITINKQLT